MLNYLQSNEDPFLQEIKALIMFSYPLIPLPHPPKVPVMPHSKQFRATPTSAQILRASTSSSVSKLPNISDANQGAADDFPLFVPLPQPRTVPVMHHTQEFRAMPMSAKFLVH